MIYVDAGRLNISEHADKLVDGREVYGVYHQFDKGKTTIHYAGKNGEAASFENVDWYEPMIVNDKPLDPVYDVSLSKTEIDTILTAIRPKDVPTPLFEKLRDTIAEHPGW